MAIATNVPGLEVTIEVDGQPLPEYNYDTECGTGTAGKNVKYIIAVSGAEFAIRYLVRPPFSPPSEIHVDILLDNNYVQATFPKWAGKDGGEGYVFSTAAVAIGGQDFKRAFRFSELRTEETTAPVTQEIKQKLAPIGQIVLYFYYVAGVKAFESANIAPQAVLDELDVVSEKALHKVSTKKGDRLTHQASLGAQQPTTKVKYSEVKTTENEPFAAFTFYYRSEAALKSLGIIPRTPSPSTEPEPEPPKDKDPNDMTVEEMRVEIQRAREQRQAIKRERENSVGTVVDNEEVIWIGTQPSERVLKRTRRCPEPDDEVVALDD